MKSDQGHKVPVADQVAGLRQHISAWRKAGETVALIPTMGALHEGHLELVRTAKRRADRAVTSIFVNPAQFSPTEDFDTYPRTFETDLEKLASVGCDLVWAPTKAVMYPEGFDTYIIPGGAAEGLETDFRPHFFRGVATVCSKLFTQSGTDFAMFGEKDYQQLTVIKQVVRDLNLPLTIVGVPTVREPDGLAMSSRNAYLTPDERQRAVTIHKVMAHVTASARTRDGAAIEQAIVEGRKMLADAGFGTIDYIAVRDAATLKPWDLVSGAEGRLLVAAWLGKTRLIDNAAL
jgi:pantoate--beta-alanine ligase